MNAILKKKPTQVALCIISILFAAYCVHGFVGMVHQTHTRAVEREFGAAVDRLQKSPPGVERVDAFIAQLKAIDTGYAPTEVKSALHDYVATLERSVDALKAGRDTKQYDPAIAEAKQRLLACVHKYD